MALFKSKKATTLDKDSASKYNITRPDVLGKSSFLSKITPKYEYVSKDDHIVVDNQVKHIIHIYAEFGRENDLQPMWGLTFIRNLIRSMKEFEHINVVFIDTKKRIPDAEVTKKQDASDKNINMNSGSGKRRTQTRAKAQRDDLTQIALDIEKYHASYIDTSLKYVVTSDSVETFDAFFMELNRQLTTLIPSLKLTTSELSPFDDMRNLLENPDRNIGRRMKMTSLELAGMYSLVSAGMEDPRGIPCGIQIGDVNNSPVLWDPKMFSEQAIIASNNEAIRFRDYRARRLEQPQFRKANGSDIWVNTVVKRAIRKDSQGDNTKVYTLALSPLVLSDFLDPITARFDMKNGYINPFEMFGEVGVDEQSAYDANRIKWETMFRQLYRTTIKDGETTVITELPHSVLTKLNAVLDNLYQTYNMWSASKNGGLLGHRNLGIPHDTVPTLDDLTEMIQVEILKAQKDNGDLSDIKTLQSLAHQLRRSQMFGNHTSPLIDNISVARHTLFDFSSAGSEGSNTQLLQFIVGFSAIVTQAKRDDIVIIHGADNIVSLTQAYIRKEINKAIDRGVKFIYTYQSVKSMLKDHEFNEFKRAEYILTGTMVDTDIEMYNSLLGSSKTIPHNIASQLETDFPYRYYLRRKYSHICFDADPLL